MKIQLKLMILTLAVFSFVNAAHDEVLKAVEDSALGVDRNIKLTATTVIGDVDHLKVSPDESKKLVEELLAKEEKQGERDADDKKYRGKLKKASQDMGIALWEYTIKGTPLRDLKRGLNLALSDDNLAEANRYKDKAYGLCCTVPKYALATAGALLLDSVTLELFFESTSWAMVAGGALCYASSYINLFSSKKAESKPSKPKLACCDHDHEEVKKVKESRLKALEGLMDLMNPAQGDKKDTKTEVDAAATSTSTSTSLVSGEGEDKEKEE